MFVYLFFCQCTIFHSLRHRLIYIIESTFHIGASQHALGSSIPGIARHLVVLPKIGNGSTIGNHKIFESPLISQYLLEQSGVATARFIVPALVSTHHLSHLGILHQRLEGREISLPKVTWTYICDIIRMASPLWSAMDGIMLSTSPEFAILGSLRSLQATHYGASHLGGEIWILTVCLLSTSPARVTEDIHIRSPYRESMETGNITTFLLEFIPLGTHLIRCGIENLEHQALIEGSCHADRLWEDGNISHVCHAMQSLAPPLESLDAKSRDSRGIIQHQGCFLLQGKTSTEVYRSLVS